MTDHPKNVATRRAANRNRHHANTLVHYLGLAKALKVCRDNMWHSVYQAIVEQHAAAGAPGEYAS